MGTRSSRHHRGTRRGLASFVSFVVLFALALGQGSSLIAWADDGTDPIATEEVVSDGTSADGTVEEAPAEEAPAEEAPSEEAPAEEAPAEEAPAEEAPADETAVEDANGEAAASAGNGGARTAPKKSQLKTATSGRTPGILSHGGLHGGDISLDFVAAGPESYNHITGVGGEYGAREIGPEGVVESLEGGDFECGDLVVFFTEVEVEAGADGSGSIELDYSFGAETTGQPGIGFTDIVSVGINTGDSAIDSNGNETATLVPGSEQTVGDELLGSVVVTGLSAGETTIVRIVVELGCEVGTPTGNLLNAIMDADVVGGDNISVGNETVPMKQVGDVARPGMNVDKTCPAAGAVGDTITYTISIQNTGNETLNLTSVVDTVNGHPPVNITASFPATIAAGATVTRTYSYTIVAADPDPLPNSVAVSATGASSGATITGSDSCSTDVLHPAIDVTKTCPAAAAVGDVITYTITVRNSGDEPLDGITVNDTLLGNLSASFADTLAVGASESHDFTYTVTASSPDPVPNTVTASGTGVTSDDTVTDTASCSTDVLHPAIDVTKTCPAAAAVGDVITYTITVRNSGDEPLDGITVNDTLLGNLSASFADTLAVGASESHDFTYTVTASSPDPVPNTVTASGTGVTSDDTVTDTASCSTDVLHPAIDVTKTCPAAAAVGDVITYTITVRNSGDEPLDGITVNDTLLGNLSASFADTLAVGASESHDFTYTVTASSPDPVPNTVTASGTGVTSDDTVTDTASCSTDVLNPEITVTKSCTPSVTIGGTITYTITVSNSGDEPLDGITVSDSLLGDLSATFADTLAVGASEAHDFTYTATSTSPDPVPNTVTASGTGVTSDDTVTDTASCSTDVLFPAINIVKDGPALVHRGDTITYTFVVTNPGEVELFDVELSDPICDAGTIDPGAEVDASLAVGEVWTFSCTHLVTEEDPDPIPNTATVRGDAEEGEGGQEVTDTDDHVVDIINPAIAIVKTVDEEVVPVGTTVTFTYVITNTGDTTLYDISVDDDILGHIGDIPVLEPGDSVTLTHDFVVGDEIVTNVGTAEGEDILGRSVSADDDATVSPILGNNPPNPPNTPPTTPFTGSDAGRLGLIAIVLFGIGVTVVASTRRRRPEREAA